MAESLDSLIDGEPRLIATGFGFTEGPLWHPDGYWHFVDIPQSRLYRLYPGIQPEIVRDDTAESNGTTFDLQGRLVLCESGNRRLVRQGSDGSITVLADRYEGKRFSRPNDVVCASDGSLYFTDPNLRVPLEQREILYGGVYRLSPEGSLSLVADCEYPNGLAFSPDERVLYVANTRWSQYIHAIEFDADGTMLRRSIFADMPSDRASVGMPATGTGDGAPDGLKVDAGGRVWCTGPGGVWVFSPKGEKLGVIHLPETPANLAFGGEDLRTLLLTARTSVYSLRTTTPGLPHPGRPSDETRK